MVFHILSFKCLHKQASCPAPLVLRPLAELKVNVDDDMHSTYTKQYISFGCDV